MVRVHEMPNATEVVQFQAFRDVPAKDFVSHAMSALRAETRLGDIFGPESSYLFG